MDSSVSKPPRKCVGIERLQGDVYRCLFNLARVCRAYELKSHSDDVVKCLKEILSRPTVAKYFDGWNEKKMSLYFYTHFLKKNPPSESARRRRELIITVSGCTDDTSPDVRHMEATRGLGCYLEERLGRPMSYPLAPRPNYSKKYPGNSSRKRSRAVADGAVEQRQDMVADDVNESGEEDNTAESSSMEDIERQSKRLATCAHEDIGEGSTVGRTIESS